MADRPGELAARPTIFANGTLAPPVTSFATSKSFCRSVDVINTHDMTLAGDASFNDGIVLVATVGQSIEGIHGRGEDEQEFWKRSEGEGDELRD
jgi:hypothetical protein